VVGNISTLTSLAILKVNVNDGKDYLDYFTPFIRHALTELKGQSVDADKLSVKILELFGLQIPRRTCEVLLARMRKRNYLTKNNGEYYVNETANGNDFITRKNEASRLTSQVTKQFQFYANEKFKKAMNDQETTELLKQYLTKFSVDCLKSYIFGSPIPSIGNKKTSDIFIVHSFVKHISENDENAFAKVIEIVKGLLLANALLCPDLESIGKKFNKVVFYIDTPIILAILGCSGPYNKKCAEEMLTLIIKNKGTVAVFDHTFNEIQEVIGGIASKIGTPDEHGRYILEMKKMGITRSDLIQMEGSLKESLNSMSILLKPTPNHIKDFQIDEAMLEKVIDDGIGYKNPRARKYDVDSIRSIFTLRSNSRPKRLEDAVAVFITDNKSLAKEAYKFGVNFEEAKEVSTVLPDSSVTNIAYLKSPLEAPSVPTTELLAYCCGGMSPSNVVWERYLNEIVKLQEQGKISAIELEHMKTSPIISNRLMEIIEGDIHKFSQKTALELRDELRKELTQDKDSELEKKSKELERKRNEILNLQQARDEEEIQSYKKTYERKKRIGRISSVVSSIFGLLMFGVLVCCIYTTWAKVDDPTSTIAIVMYVINGVFTVLNIGFGLNFFAVRKKIKDWVANQFYKLLSI